MALCGLRRRRIVGRDDDDLAVHSDVSPLMSDSELDSELESDDDSDEQALSVAIQH